MSDIEPSKPKKKKLPPAVNQGLSAAVFAGFCLTLSKFLSTVKEIPEQYRTVLHLGATLAMLFVLAQYTYATFRVAQKRSQTEIMEADTELTEAKIKNQTAKQRLRQTEHRQTLSEGDPDEN